MAWYLGESRGRRSGRHSSYAETSLIHRPQFSWTDDANADADAAAATDAAATEATDAAAATAAVAAAATTIHSCQTRVTLVSAWPANEHTLLVIRTHPGGSRAKSLPLSVPKLVERG